MMTIAGMPRFLMTQLITRWKPATTATLLSLGLAIPSASAKCFKDFSQVLKTPVVSAAVAAPSGQLATNNSNFNHDSFGANGIVGLWTATFTSGGQTVDVAFDAWHSDGIEVLNDYTNPIEGNVCLGVWTQTGPRTFKLKHPSWAFDTTGTLVGTVLIRETVTLGLDGNSYKGNYSYDIYDTTGAFVTELTGTVAATRIRPE
jgi:hypothetical protein